MIVSAVTSGAAERAGAPAPPSLEEKLAGIPRGSALAALVAANQDVSLLDARELDDDIPLPLWLRVHWRRVHPEMVYSPADPTGGYPLTLRRAWRWLLANPDLVPGPAEADGAIAADASPPAPLAAEQLAAAADLLAASVSGEMRISGLQASPRSTSDIRVDPWNPGRIIAAANNVSASGAQAQLYSSDGGASWSQTSLPLQPGDALHSGPAVDWTSNGVAWSVTTGVDAGVTSLQLRAYQSLDGGATWSFDATVSGSHAAADRHMMGIDHSATSPFTDTVYVCWSHNLAGYVNRRTGGAWQLPIRTTGAETQGAAIGCDVETNASGDLFALWPATGNRRIVVAKSTDGGASFSAGTVIATTFDSLDIGVPSFNGRGAPIYVSGGAYRTDAKDLVYATWTDLTGAAGCSGPANAPGANTASSCKTRIWFARSTNGGATWSPPAMINDQGSLNDQFSQALTVDETTGALGIVYHDTVGDAARTRADLWYQSSFDDGVSWSAPVKVTSAMTDETAAGADAQNQYGDSNGLSGRAGVFFPSWTDRRNGAREEIWTAKVTDLPCTPPGAPAIGTATATGPNQNQLTWGNGAPPATAFNVYRRQGGCAAAGPFIRIASAVAGSPFNDNTVSGGLTYAYQVTGLDQPSCGVESAASGCVEATASGGCLLPPTFAGLAGVGSAAAATCGVTLSWAAATPGCAAPAVYSVYRSTNPGFTPGPGNLIASGVSGTSYTDSLLLTSGTIYHYVVRAADSVSGVGESNLVKRAATPTGPLTTIVETFEGALSGGGFDNAGWTHAPIGGATDWVWSTAQAQTPVHSWFSDSVPGPAPSDRALASPSFVPQAGSTISFWHTFAFEGTLAECYDAGTLETTINAGTSWATFPGAAFTAGGFNGSANAGFGNPIGGRPAWCSGSIGAMTQVTANLSGLPRVDTRLRWHAGEDSSAEATGWYVDSVTISNVGIIGSCTTGGNVIFADGVESGTLGAWSGGFTPP